MTKVINLNEVIKPDNRAIPYDFQFNYKADVFRELIMLLFSQINPSYLEAKWCLSHSFWKLACYHFEDWMETRDTRRIFHKL